MAISQYFLDNAPNYNGSGVKLLSLLTPSESGIPLKSPAGARIWRTCIYNATGLNTGFPNKRVYVPIGLQESASWQQVVTGTTYNRTFPNSLSGKYYNGDLDITINGITYTLPTLDNGFNFLDTNIAQYQSPNYFPVFNETQKEEMIAFLTTPSSWESVPIINEKDLTTLNDNNNGYEITTNDASKIIFENQSKVINLAKVGSKMNNVDVQWGSIFGGTNLTFGTSVSVSIPADKAGLRALMIVVHRSTLTVPSGWTLIHSQNCKAGWQYVKIYEKICTGTESFNVTQANVSNTAMAVITCFIDPTKTVEYDNEYYPNQHSGTAATYSVEAADNGRIFVFNIGYSNNSGFSTSPSLNGGIIPSGWTSGRMAAFYMKGYEGDITVNKTSYNLSDSGAYNSDQLTTWKVVDYISPS